MDSDLHDTLEARAMSLSPGQRDQYEREALDFQRVTPDSTDADLLTLMERVQGS